MDNKEFNIEEAIKNLEKAGYTVTKPEHVEIHEPVSHVISTNCRRTTTNNSITYLYLIGYDNRKVVGIAQGNINYEYNSKEVQYYVNLRRLEIFHDNLVSSVLDIITNSYFEIKQIQYLEAKHKYKTTIYKVCSFIGYEAIYDAGPKHILEDIKMITRYKPKAVITDNAEMDNIEKV